MSRSTCPDRLPNLSWSLTEPVSVAHRTCRGEHALHALAASPLTPFIASRADGYDGLRLVRPSFVPEVPLYLADDAIVLQARIEARHGPMPMPYWANAWAGGQALARYILDNPHVVAGRSVLDMATGCGLGAIAAARSGAAAVVANDIDPYALTAVTMNAEANGVTVALSDDDLLRDDGGLPPAGDGRPVDVILAGDAFYRAELAGRMQRFLRQADAAGVRVLVGDPDRGHLPERWLTTVARYQVRGLGAAEDAEITEVAVLSPAPAAR